MLHMPQFVGLGVFLVALPAFTQPVTSPTPAVPVQDVETTSAFDLGIDGYLRVTASTFMPERFFGVRTNDDNAANPNVGRNDGFGLSDARLNVRGRYGEKLYVRVGIDAANVVYANRLSPIGDVNVGIKDAYLRFTFAPQAVIFAGRFKPPYDVEELTPTQGQFFAQRALESRGVLRHEGFSGDMTGFAPGRQIGVMLGSDEALQVDRVKFGYSAAITNGNSGFASLNDNDLPAFWLRLTSAWSASPRTGRRADEEGPATYGLSGESFFSGIVGVGGFYNDATIGDPPNRFRDRIYGAGVDAAMQIWLAELRLQVLWKRTEHLLLAQTSAEDAVGGHAQLSVRILDTGFYPGYRFALYDPRIVVRQSANAVASADDDQVMHHSFGLRYTSTRYPLAFVGDYTWSIERGGRRLSNNRVEVALQATFP